ncbi:MAG: ABC transporter permease [Opitutae bacterium]|nr:ABC transporter permease [Opitutae bacterium]
MFRFIVRRILEAIPVLFVVATVTFFLARFAPGGPFDEDRALPPAVEAQINSHYGLDKPLAVQYAKFIGNMARGDFGPSYKYHGWSVNELIADRIPVSLALGAGALALALIIGIPVGCVAAMKPNSWLDRVPTGFATIGICLPTFVTGPILVLIFSVHLGWFNASGWSEPADFVLPSLTLGLSYAAPVARMMRDAMLEVRTADYMKTAKAKGLSPLRIYFVHGLRNALNSVVSYVAPTAAALVSGSFVVESMFNIPGLGQFFVNAAFNRDFTMISGTVMFYATVLVALNLCGEIVLAKLNPRMKLRS